MEFRSGFEFNVFLLFDSASRVGSFFRNVVYIKTSRGIPATGFCNRVASVVLVVKDTANRRNGRRIDIHLIAAGKRFFIGLSGKEAGLEIGPPRKFMS